MPAPYHRTHAPSTSFFASQPVMHKVSEASLCTCIPATLALDLISSLPHHLRMLLAVQPFRAMSVFATALMLGTEFPDIMSTVVRAIRNTIWPASPATIPICQQFLQCLRWSHHSSLPARSLACASLASNGRFDHASNASISHALNAMGSVMIIDSI